MPAYQYYFEDMTVGSTVDLGHTAPLSEAEIIAFAQQYDPQPFHIDPEAAKQNPIFRGLAASGWHTAAVLMRLLVESELSPAGGIIGAGFDEFKWPRPVRPGDELRCETEILEVRPSKSKPTQGMIKVRFSAINQDDEPVQVMVGYLVVPRRPA